jgi:V8-like Glu-specific endopeptidase
MKLITCVVASAVVVSILGNAEAARRKVVYGADNRVEVNEAINPLHNKLALSTAVQIDKKFLKTEEGSDVVLVDRTSLTDRMNICSTERFASQPSVGNCSGFLVAPDLLVTAGHCMVPTVEAVNDCSRYSWVFDYNIENATAGSVSAENIYNCKEVLEQSLDSSKLADFALIRLDRAVTGREPVKFRSEGKIEDGKELVVIGAPSGLPTKIADGATVQRNTHEEFFVADLDTFGGNSGSAVFDAETGVVEGILVRGARDYVPNYSLGCYVVNVCQTMGGYGCGGESVSRITRVDILKHIKGQSTPRVDENGQYEFDF